ncbi:hypothetical protein [Lentilactobacillus senioris]|uniref:hypothetical protein n=1 Tax=Lentilactobacillus senioris TaxID=931534 RepID=UPI003D2A464B
MRKLKLHSLHDDGHALLYQLLDVCTEAAMSSVELDIDYSKKHAPLFIQGKRVKSGDIALYNEDELVIHHVKHD